MIPLLRLSHLKESGDAPSPKLTKITTIPFVDREPHSKHSSRDLSCITRRSIGRGRSLVERGREPRPWCWSFHARPFLAARARGGHLQLCSSARCSRASTHRLGCGFVRNTRRLCCG